MLLKRTAIFTLFWVSMGSFAGTESLQDGNALNYYAKPLVGLFCASSVCYASYKVHQHYRWVRDSVNSACNRDEYQIIKKELDELPATYDKIVCDKRFYDEREIFDYDSYKKYMRHTAVQCTRFDLLARAITTYHSSWSAYAATMPKDASISINEHKDMLYKAKKLQASKPLAKLCYVLQQDRHAPWWKIKENQALTYNHIQWYYPTHLPLVAAINDLTMRADYYKKYEEKWLRAKKELVGQCADKKDEDETFKTVLGKVELRKKDLERIGLQLVDFPEYKGQIAEEYYDLRTELRQKADDKKKEEERERKDRKKKEKQQEEMSAQGVASIRSQQNRLALFEDMFKKGSLDGGQTAATESLFTRVLRKIIILSYIKQYEQDLIQYSRWNMIKRIFFHGTNDSRDA